MEFEAVDWIKYSEEGYELIVPDKVHGKGPDCQIQTFGRNEEGFEVVMCDEHHNKIRSAVVLQAVTRFGGKIVIT